MCFAYLYISLLPGFFATDQVALPFSYGDKAGMPILGVYYTGLAGGHQLGIQCVGIAFSVGWSFIWTYILLQIIDKTIGLRVSADDEELGLDSSIHGESNVGGDVAYRLKTQDLEENNQHTIPPSPCATKAVPPDSMVKENGTLLTSGSWRVAVVPV